MILTDELDVDVRKILPAHSGSLRRREPIQESGLARPHQIESVRMFEALYCRAPLSGSQEQPGVRHRSSRKLFASILRWSSKPIFRLKTKRRTDG